MALDMYGGIADPARGRTKARDNGEYGIFAGEQSLDNGFYGTSCSGNGLGGSNVDGVCGGPSAAPATALGSQ